MTDVKQPKPVIQSTRTTHELVVDKENLARWVQDYVERGLVAHGITKQEIEKGFCRYQINYDQLIMLGETLMQQGIDKGTLNGFRDVSIVGSGKDAALRFTMAGDSFAQPPMSITNLPSVQDNALLDPRSAMKLIRSAFSFDIGQGIKIDSQRIVGGLQALGQFVNMANQQTSEHLRKLSPEERQGTMLQMLGYVAPMLNNYGIGLELTPQQDLSVTLHYDRLMAFLEKQGGTDRGFVVKRNGDGTASMLVDYRRMVDVAAEKAQAMLAARKGNEKLHASIQPIDGDTLNVSLSYQGNGSVYNQLLETVIEKIVSSTEEYQGGARRAFGTLGNPKSPNRGEN